jgi:hypothetical protein
MQQVFYRCIGLAVLVKYLAFVFDKAIGLILLPLPGFGCPCSILPRALLCPGSKSEA